MDTPKVGTGVWEEGESQNQCLKRLHNCLNAKRDILYKRNILAQINLNYVRNFSRKYTFMINRIILIMSTRISVDTKATGPY